MNKQLEEAKALHIGHLKDCKERIELLRHTLDAIPPSPDAMISQSMQRAYKIINDFLEK